jgi:hypothetical protein
MMMTKLNENNHIVAKDMDNNAKRSKISCFPYFRKVCKSM